jgi:hypothetical protein
LCGVKVYLDAPGDIFIVHGLDREGGEFGWIHGRMLPVVGIQLCEEIGHFLRMQAWRET